MTINSDFVELLQARQDSIRDEETVSCYLSIYTVEQCYGGPEEGGWWFTVRKLDSHIYCDNREQAERLIAETQETLALLNNIHRADQAEAYNVLGDESSSCYPEGYIPRGWSDGGQYELIVESVLGSQDNSNAPTPHYE